MIQQINTMPRKPYNRASNSRQGQAMTEYVIIAAIAAIGSIATVWMFATVTLGVFAKIAAALKNEAPDNTVIAQTLQQMRDDTEIVRNMANYDNMNPSPGTGGGHGGGHGGNHGKPPRTPPPPAPSDPLAYAARHHLGDSRAPGTSDNDLVVNEGTSYSISFFLTQDMIDYANYAHNGEIFVTFEAGNRQFYFNNFIDDETANHVFLNDRSLGTMRNGRNAMTFNVRGMRPGQQTLSFNSGNLATERDDFDFWNLLISSTN